MSRSNEDDLNNAAAFRVHSDPVTHQRKFAVLCTHEGCQSAYERTLRPGISPMAVVRAARASGWNADNNGKAARCPQHSKKGAYMSTAAVSPNAIRKQIDLMRLLELHYSKEESCYLNGKSDEALAGETGLNKEFVTRFREEGFGPLKDPAVEQFLAKVRDFEAGWAKELEDIKAMAEQAQQGIEAKAAELRRELSMLQMRRAS